MTLTTLCWALLHSRGNPTGVINNVDKPVENESLFYSKVLAYPDGIKHNLNQVLSHRF